MNWGDSVEDLKKSYPEIDFTVDKDWLSKGLKFDVLYQLSFPEVVKIRTEVRYIFYNDSLVSGVYVFTPGFTSLDKKLQDFDYVQERLYEKYPYQKTSFKVSSIWEDLIYDDIARADFEIFKKLEFKGTTIRHKVYKTSSEFGREEGIHLLQYSNKRYKEMLFKMLEEIKREEMNDL